MKNRRLIFISLGAGVGCALIILALARVGPFGMAKMLAPRAPTHGAGAGASARPQGEGAYQAQAEAQPGMPLQIISASIGPAPQGVSPQVAGHVGTYEAQVRNASQQNVIAYAVRWEAADAPQTAGGGACFTHSAPDLAHPVLRRGETQTVAHALALRSPSMRATVDLVLLSDGTAYGRNACGSLQRLQENISTHLATEQWALDTLHSQGAKSLEEKLETDLASKDAYRKIYLSPRVYPAAPSGQ